jgi:RNA polymerase sigma-70 factor (ECF subfamily)
MRRRFTTTQWSLVDAAADSANPDSQKALAELCQIYWAPVYAYIRLRGNDPDASQELTQSFFTQFLDKKWVKEARSERGKFRTFLLASVKHHMANERDRSQTQKRGGGMLEIRLDFAQAESLLSLEPVDRHTPETLFEKRWAVSVLKQAMGRLEREMVGSRNRERFVRLKPFLTGETTGTSYKDLAAELEISETAVKSTIYRLRREYGNHLREEVSQTLTDPSTLDEEIRFLLAASGS